MSPTKRIQDFSGALNLRDSARALKLTESPDEWNVTHDERGGVQSRLGYTKHNSTPFSGGVVSNAFYSGILDDLVTQAGASLYLGTTNTARKTFTTSARAVFADFNGKVYAGHPVDGLFHTTDGITWTAVADADRPTTCAAMAVWQNKLFVAHVNSTRLQWSDAGDGTAWTANAFVDIRDKDDEKIVALLGGAGIDVQGRQGLLLFKRESSYRIVSASTGEYVPIDGRVGAASALSVVNVQSRTVVLSQAGIFWTDGVNPLQAAGEREEPLWTPEQIAYGQLDLFCAGAVNGRAYFSLPRVGATANNLALEYHPDQSWVAARSDAASCYTTYALNDQRLLGGSPTVTGQVYRFLNGGTDDGTAITSYYQSAWVEPGAGDRVMLLRLRIHGRGAAALYVRRDYETSGGDRFDFDLAADDANTYDSGLTYDSGAFYDVGLQYEGANTFASLGHARSFSFRIEASTSDTETSPVVLGGVGSTLGSWALYALDFTFQPLGTA